MISLGRPATCTHHRCRTTLDQHPVTCPHGLPFCDHCTWEEACDDCEHDARMGRMTAAAEAAWNAEPPRTWDNPRTQADIDARAESRHEQDKHEYAELMMREQDARW